MPLTPDQDDLLKQNILKGFGAPQAPAAPIGASSFDVTAMGPNLDDTLKTPPASPAPAVSNPAMMPPAAPVALPAMPKPATPTGAPAAPGTDPRIGSSHPGLSDDDLARYVSMQKGEIDKYGPDHEAAVMDDIRKKYHSPLNSMALRAAGAADNIMQGVARAGSGQNLSNLRSSEEKEMEQQRAAAEHEGEASLKNVSTKQGLDQMDPNSTIGRAMLSTWGPLMDKMGVPKEQQAKMLPALLGSVVPEQVKQKEADARIQASKEQREMMLGMRTDQYDQNQWVKLGNSVNALTAGSRKALGIAAASNMRADRLLETAGNKDITAQDVSNMVQDIQGIYKGGVPDEIGLKHGQYQTLMQDISNILSYVKSKPAAAKVPEVVDHLKKLALELKQVDNKAINDNLGINAVQFRPIIEKDPSRWGDMVGAVKATTTGVPGQAGTPAAAAPYGDTVQKDGKTYVWNPSTGKYHPQ